MNNISLQSNTQMTQTSLLCSRNVAHDAGYKGSMQSLSEVLCAYVTAMERPEYREE